MKRRLVGATVLVLLAVVFVPLLVDPGDTSLPPDLPGGAPPAPREHFESTIEPLPGSTASTQSPSSSAAPSAPGGEATPLADLPTAEPLPEPVVSLPGGDDAAAGTGDAVVTEPATSAADAASDDAAPSSAASAAGSTVGDTGGSGTTDVDSAPEADEENDEASRSADAAADAVASNADEPDATTASPPASAVDAAEAGWSVQLGTFAKESNAVTLVRSLRAKGHNAIARPVAGSEPPLVRVLVGPLVERADAEALREALKTSTGLSGLVVSFP